MEIISEDGMQQLNEIRMEIETHKIMYGKIDTKHEELLESINKTMNEYEVWK